MGRRGPAPTPTARLNLRGTFRKDRHSDDMKPALGRPMCPKWLDPEAKRVWRRIVPMLESLGVLSRIDRNALTRYCQMWSRWKKTEQFLNTHGDSFTVKDESGRAKGVALFPQVDSANRLSSQLMRLEQEFGLTPSARSRIRIDPTALRPPNPLDQYFADCG